MWSSVWICHFTFKMVLINEKKRAKYFIALNKLKGGSKNGNGRHLPFGFDCLVAYSHRECFESVLVMNNMQMICSLFAVHSRVEIKKWKNATKTECACQRAFGWSSI